MGNIMDGVLEILTILIPIKEIKMGNITDGMLEILTILNC
jgi:hypothetical protein